MSSNISNSSGHKTTGAIIEEATEWLVRIQESEVDAAEKQAFAEWLRRSPLHVREYLRAEATWATLENVDPQRHFDVNALLLEASNVVELASTDADKSPGSRSGTQWSRWFAVAAGIVAVGVLSWLFFVPETLVYQTGLGEQRRVVLTDGSVVELNTQTEIEIELGSGSREVRLLNGEALFTVAADPQRPFMVLSDQARVQVLGTEFNIYQKPGQVTVSVLDGLVAVSNRDSDSGSGGETEQDTIQLAAGYEVKIHTNNSQLNPTTANTERVVAWRDLRLIFENNALADVVDEFNRYNRKQLIILDPMLKAQQINGVFDADRPETLMRFLVQSEAARVVKETDNRIVLESVL